MDENKDKKIIKSPYYSLEKLSEDSSLVKRGLRDLSIWPKIEELFKKLKSQYEAEKYPDCIITAEEILKTDSNHFFTLCYFARSLYFVERYEEALKILERCLEDEKEYYFLWSFRGDVYYKMGKYLETINDYDEALRLELYEVWCQVTGDEKKAGFPQYSPEYANAPTKPKASSFWENEDDSGSQEEIFYFRKAQFYLSTRGAIYNEFKENDIGKKRAVEALKRVIDINPSNWFAVNQIVEALDFLAEKQRGVNNQEAFTYIDTALHYDPNNTNLLISKAILLYHLGEKERAVELISMVKEKYPDHDGVDFIYKKINDLE
ncbi:TPA: hypothetical protein DEW47_03020 [Patescibacteria group bacterium]|nr:MAG: TPR-domain containing protein [Parcubacteria group bacterium GW2011_GWF2_40_10]KKR48064.1 MAG: TPR-domain containing protein [Parcubacteria group bacterium GW2011_GWA2_40_143]KKR60544.1 MAG: TPR-domain containing protein [Parcubacteria group bacterium GW2011_GWC2_40_31]KKR75607.1 MAG: TPR-domain containing protein [Parcubacteria group bacterium GW2011_GWB2_40_8]KKR77505.1 MAG: TPR-domain containing protein [Parcubacteria group bacterium GW2011_GWE2_40_8]KKR81546.1 MAG: TPR-domain conta